MASKVMEQAMHSYLINEAEMEEKKAARLRAQADELEAKLPPDGENNGVNRIFSLAITICYRACLDGFTSPFVIVDYSRFSLTRCTCDQQR